MREFSSELLHSYETYSFGYCRYAELEKGDELTEIYTKGFLPYSGSPDAKNLFYMARSARIPLAHWTLNSENRRIAKRFDGQFLRTIIPFGDFNWHSKQFLDFCTEYFEKRHGPNVMPRERLIHLLQGGLITHIACYSNPDKHKIAYVLKIGHKHMTHFWFSFYDLSLAWQSLGMWLMLDAARTAKEQKKDYFYVGTIYGEKALYKSNFSPLEFWNGEKWIHDEKKLKVRSRSDHSRETHAMDEWKETHRHF